MLKPIPNKLNLPEIDHQTLEFWEQHDIFQRSIDQDTHDKEFVFFDGPPGTNGVPHIGHIMQSALKDLWPRYKTMQGYRVLRKAGWDTHGLPVEMTADKELGFKSKLDVVKYGEQKYIDHCRKTVFRYKETWETAIRRSGRFIDLKDAYATYRPYYIQSDWWTLKQAWNLELEGEAREKVIAMGQSPKYLYRDYRIMAYSPRTGTTLSNFEVAQGYKDVTDITLYVKFRVKGEANTYLTAWTTTPWTLFSNLAIAVGSDIEYVTVELLEDTAAGKAGEKWILAHSRLAALEPMIGKYRVVGTQPGSKLTGTEYEPMWDWLEEFAKPSSGSSKQTACFVIEDEYVTTEDGTGLVHLAYYGEDDYRILRKNGVPLVLTVDAMGMVSDFAKPFAGRWFRDEGLDIEILKALKEKNLLIDKEKYEHAYPFDYRTGSPLMYFPRPAWFLRTTELKEMMIRANREIGWKPEHIRDGRFGNWLENVQDWNVTRERYWGSPLPVWRTEDGSESICFGSIAELADAYQKAYGKSLPDDFDPHKPQIDQIILKASDGQEMRRDNFVLDSWFNAGLMPWGQWGYPSEPGSPEQFKAQYPCDFICEGLDQTRGWFYTMLACSCLIAKAKLQELQNSSDETAKQFWSNPVNWSSYKNCICTELVLDHTGQKMSKSLGNVVDPMELFEKFGADPVRWIFYSSNPWNAKRFGEEEIRDGIRAVILPLWNSYSFFVTYAQIDNWTPNSNTKIQPTQMDRWIVSEYYRLIDEVIANLDQYEVAPASTAIVRFLDLLTNWYIRRSRRRFWKSESDIDKATAYSTLYQVLVGLTHIMAPFLPFLTEFIYQNLVRSFDEKAPESIHLAAYPRADASKRDAELEANMENVRTAVTLARSIRQEKNLKVRQPLTTLTWVIKDENAGQKLADFLPIIAEEINVRDVNIIQNDEELVELNALPNLKVLGKKVGRKMNDVSNAVKALDTETLRAVEAGGTVKVDEFELTAEEILIKRTEKQGLAIQSDQGMTIALNTTLTPELVSEGLAREVVHHIQNLRKENGFEITDRIQLSLSSDSETLSVAIQSYKDYICRETLALELTLNESTGGTELKTGDYSFSVNLRRVESPSA